jgi:hypothetical protein
MILFCGCTEQTCLLPSQKPMVMTELYFGEPEAGDWARFAATVLTPAFPLGFTVLNGHGQWQNPNTGRIGREASTVVLVAAAETPDLAARIDRVAASYRAGFHQQSVGVVSFPICGAFGMGSTIPPRA